MPWDYVRFLDYATDRIFLRRVGGGYIFVHRLLLEHFAALGADEPPTASSHSAAGPPTGRGAREESSRYRVQ